MSTGTDPDKLTLANVKDGTIKYKTPRKNKLQLLCGEARLLILSL
jgi:hypothetical protein